MASNSQSGFGSRLLNSLFLIEHIKTLVNYNPIIDVIKIINYEPFVTSVQNAMSPYNIAFALLKDSQNLTEEKFTLLVNLVRKIRNVILEIYGKSDKYDDYNELIDLITGDNVSKHSYKRNIEEVVQPPAEPGEDFVSVSQLDRGSQLAHFTALIDMLEQDPNYQPNENELKIIELKNFRDSLNTLLLTLGTHLAEYQAQRAIILPLFDGPDSLHERAERAKVHVKRVYGSKSIEYKALTGKTY